MLLAATVYAMPSIGDIANYNITITQKGQSMSGTLEQIIINQVNGMYNIQSTININGQTQVQNDQKKPEALFSDALVKDLLAHCANYSGQLATITVPAGIIDTCAVPTNEEGQTGTIWFSSVAFGVVKMDSTTADGDRIYLELVSFKFGQ